MLDKLIELIEHDCKQPNYVGACWHLPALEFIRANADTLQNVSGS